MREAGGESGLGAAASEWDTPMYRQAVAQLDAAARQIDLDENLWERLRSPQRAHVVSFPFRRDDYRTRPAYFAPAMMRASTPGKKNRK